MQHREGKEFTPPPPKPPPIPPGRYNGVIAEAERIETKMGKTAIKMRFQVLEPEGYTNEKLFVYALIPESGKGWPLHSLRFAFMKLRSLMRAVGSDIRARDHRDGERWVNMLVKRLDKASLCFEVKHQQFEDRLMMNVTKYMRWVR